MSQNYKPQLFKKKKKNPSCFSEKNPANSFIFFVPFSEKTRKHIQTNLLKLYKYSRLVFRYRAGRTRIESKSRVGRTSRLTQRKTKPEIEWKQSWKTTTKEISVTTHYLANEKYTIIYFTFCLNYLLISKLWQLFFQTIFTLRGWYSKTSAGWRTGM